MNFYIDKIILWLNNGKTRILNFKNDKVNVITGNSKTGKTAILQIIDYCFCSSENNISKQHIGKNVAWYGINFHINNKLYTIARGNVINGTNEFYFSSTGEIPQKPKDNFPKDELKDVLEQEFSINKNTTITFGSKNIKQGSKISYRYFLLFNTLTGDIIEHSKTYFDKQDKDRYRDALVRIFDLATGIITIEDLLLKEQLNKLNIDLNKYNRDLQQIETKINTKNIELKKIIKKAIEVKLISESINNFNDCVIALNKLITSVNLSDVVICDYSEELGELKIKKQELEIQKIKLKRFQRRYKIYRDNLKTQAESLKPIEYIQDNFSKNIKNDEYRQFLNILETDYQKIKNTVLAKMPFEKDIADKLDFINNKIKELDEQIELIPVSQLISTNDKNRLIAIGEIKNKFLELTNTNLSTDDIINQIKICQNQIDQINSKLGNFEENKNNVINALNDYIKPYIEKASLDEYREYLPNFDYVNKMLKLREPKTTYNEQVSSSSDHMFLHLCLFFGLHEMLLDKELPYVPPFIIIDQPTRPYFVNTENNFEYKISEQQIDKKNDWSKVLNIFELLDMFMNKILENKKHFQIILLEHVSKNAWKDTKHIHLVEEFDGQKNALIPPDFEKNSEA